jgi:aspartate ammonia-lyase
VRLVLTSENVVASGATEAKQVEVVYTAIPVRRASAIAESEDGFDEACAQAVEAACQSATEGPCPQTTVVLERRAPVAASPR